MRVPALCLALGILAGCAPRLNSDPGPGGLDADGEPGRQSARVWNATLVSFQGSGISGTGRAVAGGGETRVTVNIMGAQPRTAHPWHVHQGTCDSGGAIVGSAGAYPPLMVGTTGQAQRGARVGVSLDGAQNYHINVHASANDMGTIVACGDLND